MSYKFLYRFYITKTGFSADWSTETFGTSTAKIIDFSGIRISNNYEGTQRIHKLEDITFKVPSAGLTKSDFDNTILSVFLYLDTGAGLTAVAGFDYTIVSITDAYGIFTFTARDRWDCQLKRNTPATRYLNELWPEPALVNSTLCVPDTFGTPYIPLYPVYDKVVNTDYVLDTGDGVTTSFSGDCLSTREDLQVTTFVPTYTIGTVEYQGATDAYGVITGTNITSGSVAADGTWAIVFSTAPDNAIDITADFTIGSRYYLANEYSAVGPTVTTVHKMHSPDTHGNSTWVGTDDGGAYTFNKILIGNGGYYGIKAIIYDADGDDIPDSNILFPYNGIEQSPIFEYENNDRSSITSPGRIIATIIFPTIISSTVCPTGLIDITYSAADIIFSGWGLSWHGAIYNKTICKDAMSRALLQCHAAVKYDCTMRDKVVTPLSKTSVFTLTNANIIQDTFSYNKLVVNNFDGCFIAYSNDRQDKLYKYKVAINDTDASNTPSDEVIEMEYVNSLTNAVKLGILYNQWTLGKEARVKFNLPFVLGTNNYYEIMCDDVLTIQGSDYGDAVGYDVVVENLTFTTDGLLEVEAVKYDHDLEDFTDLSITPDSVGDAVDDSSVFTSISPGPVVTTSTGNAPNVREGFIGLEGIIAYNSNGLLLGDDAAQGPLVNDGGAITNAYQPAFLVRLASSQSFNADTYTTVHFDTEIQDTQNEFNTTTYTHTASKGGTYHYDVHVSITNADVDATYYFILLITSNRTYITVVPQILNSDSLLSINLMVDADMDINDTAYVQVEQASGANQASVYQSTSTIYTYFSGHLVA